MLFNSLTFLLLHFISITLYWSLPNQKGRLFVLLASSFIFYGWYYWPGLILLVFTILINYGLTWALDKYRQQWIFILGIVLNLVNLSWFKYSTFLAENLENLFWVMDFDITVPKPDYWLPLGISFYTFQFMGYLIDLNRRQVEHERSLLNFAVFKCLYAQLIAGPIVRANELLPQLNKKATFDITQFQRGFFLMVGGLFIKICVADILAQFVEFGFTNASTISTLHAWLSLYGFAFQILSDFWGYSTIAIGIGLMYGISLPKNFNFPYTAISLQDFWRRWHITLSIWFRDYLYIPLGGNRTKLFTYRNIIITMAIAGVWHGAGWNFIFWGLGHGIILAIERKFEWQKMRSKNRLLKGIRLIIIFHLVCLLWVFFRAVDFSQAMAFFDALLLPDYSAKIKHLETLVIVLILFAVFHIRLGKLFDEDNFTSLSLRKQVVITAALLLFILAYSDARLDFIYFVF